MNDYRILRFAGPATNEPLEPGRHVTIRREAGWKSHEGEYVMLVDLETGRKGFAVIKEVVGPLSLEDIRALGKVKGERTPYNTGKTLAAAMLRFYGDEAYTSRFEAVEYITFLAEVEAIE